MSFKRARTSSFSQPTQPGYGYQLTRPRYTPRRVGRSYQGASSAAKGGPKSFRVRAPAALKRVVKAIIDQEKEQKIEVQNLYAGALATILSTSELSGPDFYSMAPTLNQGPSDGMRVGSDVKLIKSYVRFQISCNQQASDANGPFIVTVWIGKVRGLASAVPSTADFASLLTTSTINDFTAPTTTLPFTGMLPVNDDLWDIKVRKEYKVGKSGRTDSATNCNNDFNLCYLDEINVTKMFPSKLRYNGGDSIVEEDNLFFFATYRTLDGSGFSSGLPTICAAVTHRYTDA